MRNESKHKNSPHLIPGGDYNFSITESLDDCGIPSYEIMLTPNFGGDAKPRSEHQNSRRPNHELIEVISDALAEDSEEAEFLTYPNQQESFVLDFKNLRDRARRAFRESTATDEQVNAFELHMETDRELVEKATLIRRLYCMGLEGSGTAFYRYVETAHRRAVEYATKVLSC